MMNNRIKELAKQAGFILWDDEEWATGVLDWASNYDEALEKFAKLIVRECANHIMASSDRYRKEYFAEKILEHFEAK